MSSLEYEKSGVNIHAAEHLVKRIKSPVAETQQPWCSGQIGMFASVFDPKKIPFHDPLFLTTTDGVGTKIKLATELNEYESIGVDLVAMCVNDLLVHGAQPLVFLDYIACSRLDPDVVYRIIKSISKGCRIAQCTLSGGETAEMPGVYSLGDHDLAGFAVGAVERTHFLDGTAIRTGDIVLGLPSSGFHSNGYSLIRKIIKDHGFHPEAPAPFDPSQPLKHYLMQGTRIYTGILPILEKIRTGIHGLCHITGGGILGNTPRILPPHCAVQLDPWKLPPLFHWIQQAGSLKDEEMLSVLNCGYGMLVITDPQEASAITQELHHRGEKAVKIGTVIERRLNQPSITPISFLS